MFGESASNSGDLFGSTLKQKARTVAAPTPAKPQNTVSSRRKLDPAERTTRFNELFEFVSSRIGLKPVVKTPEQVRNSAWGHLFELATARAQLERVTELFPLWRDSRREFNEQTVKNFIRRCDELNCPDLALDVFSNHSKYGFPLASVAVGRQLMHSLHLKHSLASSVTPMALYPAYNLPPISTDLVSSTMLVTACLNQDSKQSKVLVDVLLPSIKRLLKNTPPTPPSKPIRYSEDREPFWLARTLAKIEEALQKRGGDHQWLREWRERSGHLAPTS
ncbi:hypothetical protein BDM02DRAFT_3089170 [Thelephora ganbajun]|uniref:Uncharacterized protein n=1 Tax=Thelephora ganbajun TaxID=370292 RepID=A0ACB6ZSM4_THEGA|nr:hypothetical protein BDM02DRAFT_3089170 [Thelephora ganbajun]